MPITPITVADLTSAKVNGTGIFDVLMAANKAHLEEQFSQNRIRGPEYSQVYLGSLVAVLNTAAQFLLTKDKIALEATLIEKQIELTTVEVQKAQAELAIIQAGLPKINAEIAHIEAQTALVTQQVASETLKNFIHATDPNLSGSIEQERRVLLAQKCKLDAEFDVLMLTKDKTLNESALLAQKVATERAQTISTGVDADSVIGTQKGLYTAQTKGFKRDAEQKAAKLLTDSWSVRRTTDETGTQANATNKLDDATIGTVVNKMVAGIDQM